MVLAPYWSGNPGVYEALLSDLARDHRVVTWDARGTGQSTPDGPYDMATDCSDLEEVLDRAGGEAVVIGTADGTNRAVHVAASRRDLVAAVVALGTAPFARVHFEGTEGMIASDTVVGAFIDMLEHDYRGALRTLLSATNTQMSEPELRERVASQISSAPGARSGTGPRLGGGRPDRRRTGDRGAPLDPLRPRRRRSLAAARRRAPKAGRDADPKGACPGGRGGMGADLAPRPLRRLDPPDHRTTAPRIERVSASPANRTWILTGSLENFRVNVERGFDVIGFKEGRRRQAEEFEPGDEMVFYVTGVQAFGAIARVTFDMFEDRAPIWPPGKKGRALPVAGRGRAGCRARRGRLRRRPRAGRRARARPQVAGRSTGTSPSRGSCGRSARPTPGSCASASTPPRSPLDRRAPGRHGRARGWLPWSARGGLSCSARCRRRRGWRRWARSWWRAACSFPWYGIQFGPGLSQAGLDSFGLANLALLLTVGAAIFLIVRCAGGYELPARCARAACSPRPARGRRCWSAT